MSHIRWYSAVSASFTASRATALAALAISLISVFLTFSLPAPKSAETPPTSFSAVRARALLDKAARVPHPVYSEAKYGTIHEIEEYLRSGGLEPWTTTAEIVSPRKKTGGSIRNLWARIKADEPIPALKPIVLTAHYDSVPFGPGASDNGSGTATLAETARALAAMSPGERKLRRDIVFLWTDGEEFGQLGAEAALESGTIDPAFVLAIDTAKDTPLYIVDLTPDSAKTLDTIAGARAGTIGFSWTDIVKGMLPVDSDYSPFRIRGIPGACVGAPVLFADYHSARDTAENVDERAMQQAGDMMLRCARSLGVSVERDFRGRAESYFPIGGIGLAHYPSELNFFLLALATIILLLALIVPGRRPKAAKTLAGIGLSLGLVILAAIGGIALDSTGGLLAPDIKTPRYSAHLPHDWLWAAAAFALALALFFSAASIGRKGENEKGIFWGFAFLTLAGGWASALAVPQASYVFAVPALAFSAALLASVVLDRAELWGAVAATIAGVIFLPLFPAIFLGLGLRGIAAMVPAAALVLLCWSPLLSSIPARAKKIAPALAAGSAIAFVAAAVCFVRFSPAVPEPTNLGYVLNADRSEAAWFILGKNPTARQRFRSGSEAADLGRLSPFATIIPSTAFRAPVFPVARPSVSVVSDGIESGKRKLHMLVSGGLSGGISIGVPADSGLEAFEIGGRAYSAKEFFVDAGRSGDGKSWYVLTFYPCDTKTLDVGFTLRPGKQFDLTVASLADGLDPGVRTAPIPPGSASQNDSTSVVRTFSFR